MGVWTMKSVWSEVSIILSCHFLQYQHTITIWSIMKQNFYDRMVPCFLEIFAVLLFVIIAELYDHGNVFQLRTTEDMR